jgi:hypothetical protein
MVFSVGARLLEVVSSRLKRESYLEGLREQQESWRKNHERENKRESTKERCGMEKATDPESVFRDQAAGHGTSVYGRI